MNLNKFEISVAVTAAGGGVGESIIKSLKQPDSCYGVVGIDPRPDSAGLFLSDVGVIGKKIDDPEYITSLIEICRKNGCKYLFSGLDSELKHLSKNKNKFLESNIIPIISNPETVELSDNKWKLYEFLVRNGFPYIKSSLSMKEAKKMFGYPMVLKPMIDGCRSKDVFICQSDNDVKDVIIGKNGKHMAFIFQEYIEGDEYTCGTITFDKKIIGTIQMTRELRNGDTYKAHVKNNPCVNELLYTFLPKIDPFGPCNVQLRVKDNVPYILEINARCSGTTAARALAGFNEPVIILDYLRFGKVHYEISDISILRYWNECIVPKSKLEEVTREGIVNRS